MKQRKRRDILNLSLKHLPVGDSIICTNRTYHNISSRLQAFFGIYPDRKYVAFNGDGVRNIKRLA